MQLLLELLGELVAAAFGDALRSWRARRRRAALRRGEVVDLRCRLAVGDARARRGRLVLATGRAVWVPARGGDVRRFAGARDLREVARATVGGVGGRVLVELSRPDGPLRLRLPAADAANLEEALAGSPSPAIPVLPRAPGRTWWAVGCLVAAALWAGAVGWVALDTYTATATVVGSPEWGVCDVHWTDASGGSHRALSDCLGENPGTQIDVLVPTDGSDEYLTTAGVLWVSGGAVSLPLSAIGGLRLSVVRRRRRAYRAAMREAGGWPAAEGPPPALVTPRTAAALRRARRWAWVVTGLGVVCLVVFGVLLSVMTRADDALRADGSRVVGTVLDVRPDGRWSSGRLTVEVVEEGRRRVEQVPVGGYADYYEDGDRVDVFYDPSHPERLTVDDVMYEPPGTTWPAIVAFVGAPTAWAGGAWMLGRARRLRRILAVRPWEEVRVRMHVHRRGLDFVVGTHDVWRARSAPRWPVLDRAPRELAGWDLPDEDPTDVPADQDAWWVTDGTLAVFSPDQGSPLVVARRPRR